MIVMSEKMKTIFVDMDGVLADFEAGVNSYIEKNGPLPNGVNIDEIPEIFNNLPVMNGAIDAIIKLYNSGKYDMFVATTAPWDNPEALTHKRLWIEKWFGDIFYKRLFTTHRKDLLIGDYLIDDRTVNGAGEFTGEHIHFGTETFPNWEAVIEYLL
jgi:5'-nucleotidase